MSDSVFSVRSPKPDSIKAVKLTHDNIRNVGAELLKRGFKVEVNAGGRAADEVSALQLVAPFAKVCPVWIP